MDREHLGRLHESALNALLVLLPLHHILLMNHCLRNEAHGIDHSPDALVGVRGEVDSCPVHGRLTSGEPDTPDRDAPPPSFPGVWCLGVR